MAKKAVVAMLVAVAVAVVVAATTSAGGRASAEDCNIAALAVCKAAVMDGAKPTAVCCSNLRAQEACLCKFQKDPKYGKYIVNPNARKMVTSCGMAIPNC